jgi:hypothetical protein
VTYRRRCVPERIVVLEMLLSSMKTAGAQRSAASFEASLPLRAKERSVLAAAIHQGCGASVTGERTPFGALFGRTIHGVNIHSPRSLAEALLM